MKQLKNLKKNLKRQTKTEEGKKTSIPEDEDIFVIEGKDYNKLIGEKLHSDDQKIVMSFKDINDLYKVTSMDKNRYELKYDIIKGRAYLKDIKPITTAIYGENEINKYLNNTGDCEILKSYKIKLPSNYKDKSMEEFQKAFNKGLEVAADLKRKIRNVEKYEKDTETGILKAYADKGDSAHPISKKKY